MNRKFVDEFGVEFCLTMYFKGNRSRLAQALFNVDKSGTATFTISCTMPRTSLFAQDEFDSVLCPPGGHSDAV